jgi:hypothetical protein
MWLEERTTWLTSRSDFARNSRQSTRVHIYASKQSELVGAVHYISSKTQDLTAREVHTITFKALIFLPFQPHPSWARRKIFFRAPPAMVCCGTWAGFTGRGAAAQLVKA